MNKELLKVSLRQRALYLPQTGRETKATAHTLALAAELHSIGFALTEDLLHALNALDNSERRQVIETINEVMGTELNWASLTKDWLTPTGESRWDHFLTAIANMMGPEAGIAGTTLPCGHLIPDGTFPLERYNGCPFCGTPFRTANFVYRGQGSQQRLLHLWGDTELEAYFHNLLLSPVPLDATQHDSLKTLLHYFSPLTLPESCFSHPSPLQKETLMLVIDELVERERDDEAGRLFTSPADVMRYLWYRHTGKLQILRPQTLLHIEEKNNRYEWNSEEAMNIIMAESRQQLKLKYSRSWCRRVARWMNTLPMPIDRQLEAMHPKREMWVRFIRALRLAEYARHEGYVQLRVLMDRFYRTDYEVWQGQVDNSRRNHDAEETLRLLRQRPGLFARCLFSTMLRLGWQRVIAAFQEVVSEVSPRLLLTLGAQAELYFDPNSQRLARPLSGIMKPLPPHPLVTTASTQDLEAMRQAVRNLYLEAMRQRFASLSPTPSHTSIYIEPQLFNIPVAVGDRNATIQDVSAALQGTRFPISGDRVRLFLQWGKDLPAQHLDMDLSCHILTDTEATICSYFSLHVPGAKHSGDIQQIPDKVGTAEYIELDLPELEAQHARRVVFTCNAYTQGALSPNLVVGWMSASKPMTVSDETGVAYDPSTVDHMVRISEGNLTKGLIFGVLDVASREITWLEMPFDGQTILGINPQSVDTYLRRLKAKPTIGEVLRIMADAQGLTIVDDPAHADQSYTMLWAQDAAQVSRLLLG